MEIYRVCEHGGNIECANMVAIYRVCEHGCNIECEKGGNIECVNRWQYVTGSAKRGHMAQ